MLKGSWLLRAVIFGIQAHWIQSFVVPKSKTTYVSLGQKMQELHEKHDKKAASLNDKGFKHEGWQVTGQMATFPSSWREAYEFLATVLIFLRFTIVLCFVYPVSLHRRASIWNATEFFFNPTCHWVFLFICISTFYNTIKKLAVAF